MSQVFSSPDAQLFVLAVEHLGTRLLCPNAEGQPEDKAIRRGGSLEAKNPQSPPSLSYMLEDKR